MRQKANFRIAFIQQVDSSTPGDQGGLSANRRISWDAIPALNVLAVCWLPQLDLVAICIVDPREFSVGFVHAFGINLDALSLQAL